jgi:amino acid adenylation domain-containing protein/non-ribosomal peptide synthase protein (TIGR01720 family)
MTEPASLSTAISPERLASLSPAKRALFLRLQAEAKAPPAVGPARRDPGEPAPLSYGQERLWFLDQLEPGNPFYNVAIATRLSGKLDAQILAHALHAVIERHEALRTVFRTVAGRPEQVVCPTTRFQLAHDDLSMLSGQARDEALGDITQAEAVRPFDLAHGPLIRARLVRLARDENVLLLTLHHIICDGWSLAVLRQEVAEQYAAMRAGRKNALPELPLQFADHAIRERAAGGNATTEAHLQYWREQLSDLPGPLALPLDFPRPAVQAYRGATERLRLTGPLVRNLRRLAAEENGTLCMVLMAAFQIVLARYARQHDVCVGMPIAGRTSPELERLIGFFVNTLVIRGRLANDLTFRDFLSQLRATMLAAYEHQELPFSRLVEELVPARDLGRSPLVQVMFVLQNIPVAPRQVAGLTITDNSFDHAPVSNFDLTLNVDEHPDRLDLSLVYNPDLFMGETAAGMLDAYRVLLTAIVGNRDCAALELPLLSASAKRQQLQHWNATGVSFPEDRCIHELFAEQVRRTPNAVAIRFEDAEITYRQLDQRSNQLARYLIERGASSNVPVGVCLGRSPEVIVAILAILKAGAAYLPIDPLYPQARRAAMIEDALLQIIVTDSEVANCLPPGDYRRILMDAGTDALAAVSDEALAPTATPDDCAYVIYTSGSTGQPKGVEVPHRGLVNHAIDLARRAELRPGDALLQYLSLSFDAAIEEIFPTLTSGATLHMHPSPAELSGRVLLDWTRENRVNVLHLPTVVWSSLVNECAKSGGAAARHLKTVIVGGDSIPIEQVERWRAATGDACRFLFAYGVTEATITSTLFDPADRVPTTASKSLPIGRPIANTRLYVLDEMRQPLPAGVAGELYIGGVGVARGYLGRPELTKERFLPDPFASAANARMYRTGDLVRYLADGNVEFLGRVDRQLKVRGYRIEPAEIEAVLQLHPLVREAIVVPRGQGEARRLAAYVGSGEAVVSEEELREFLTARLPGHMLPAALVILAELPRLSCAKVDVASLPEPSWERGAKRAPAAPPTSDVERALVKIWAEVLGHDTVGVHDNFFDIGGDSIRSIQVVARAGAAGWKITPKQLFQNQTIAELARVAQAGQTAIAPQEPVVGPAPLLPIQHEFFALADIEPHHHNQAVMLAVSSAATPQIIERALQAILTHHDQLRARFQRDAAGNWTQEIMPPGSEPILEIVHLARLNEPEQSMAIEHAAATTQAGLDLGQGPIARFVYFDCGPAQSARLLCVIHHLVIDAVSWRILLADLDLACQQLAAGLSAQLPAKTTPAGEWSNRLAQLADSEVLRGQRDLWLSTTERAKPLPREINRGDNIVANADTVRMTLDAATTDALLHEAPAAYRARTQELLLAALVQVLRDYCGSGPLHLNLESHGREDLFADVDLSRTVGWFTALYPARFEISAGGSVGALVRTVKEQFRAIPQTGLGYGLLRWLSDDAETREKLAAANPPEICFNFLGNLDHTLSAETWFALAPESPGSTVSPHARRRHIWEIIAVVREGALHVEWHYSCAHHHRATVERLADKYLAGLRALVESSGEVDAQSTSASDFPLADVDQSDFEALQQLLARG